MAIRLYSFNVQLSVALYGPLYMLEIALRNVSDRQMCAAFGEAWLDDRSILWTGYQQHCVEAARATLQGKRKVATHSQMVAELTFGFWTSLFGRDSHHLWGTLRPMFQAKGVQRGVIAGPLRDLRILRNRMAHYEPILARPGRSDMPASRRWLGGYRLRLRRGSVKIQLAIDLPRSAGCRWRVAVRTGCCAPSSA